MFARPSLFFYIYISLLFLVAQMRRNTAEAFLPPPTTVRTLLFFIASYMLQPFVTSSTRGLAFSPLFPPRFASYILQPVLPSFTRVLFFSPLFPPRLASYSEAYGSYPRHSLSQELFYFPFFCFWKRKSHPGEIRTQ